MKVHISRAVLEEIVDRVDASPDAEVCGLLLGTMSGEGARISEARAAENVAREPARRFELDPAQLFAAHREARSGASQVLGHYHSHPGGSVEPSACDAEMAMPDGALWLICAPGGAYALWRAGAGGLHGRFVRIALEVAP